MGQTSPELPRRRRKLSLSVGGLMLLVLVVGLPLGWKARRASLQRRGVAAVEKLRGAVTYDWQYGGGPYQVKPATAPPGPAWLRRIIGDEYFQEVAQVALPGQLADIFPDLGAQEQHRTTFVFPLIRDQLACLDPFDRLEGLVIYQSFPLTGEGLDRLAALTRLKSLMTTDNFTRPADAARLGSLQGLEYLSISTEYRSPTDLAFLAKLPRLRTLLVNGLGVTDDHLKTVGQLRTLETLSLWGPGLTDRGIAHLRNLRSLRFLMVVLPRNLTGRGLAALGGMTELQSLFLEGMTMDEEGLDHLRELPALTTVVFAKGRLDDQAIARFQADRPKVTLTLSP